MRKTSGFLILMLGVLGVSMGCQSTQADNTPFSSSKEPGTTLRAQGNEPPWIVDVYPDRFVLMRGYEPQTSEHPMVRYGLSYLSQDFTLTISPEVCYDSMSGKKFTMKAELKSENETLTGCARPLN